MTKTIPNPFPITLMDKESVEVKNPYSGASVMLTPQATAVYDCIKGAEILGHDNIVMKGLDWFRQYYPKEYMVLLD